MRRRRKTWPLCLAILISLLSDSVLSFNLDPRIPVVKLGGVDSEAYFGYSVAQHRTGRGSSGEPRILVGAPRDDNLQPGTRRSGALWSCGLTGSMTDCEQVITDGKRSMSVANRTYGVYDGGLNRLNPPIRSEIKDGQWLGVEVVSQGEGGKVIVCAHRYTVRDVSKHSYKVIDSMRGMLGLCYILNPDLSLPANDAIGYKNVMAVRDAVSGKRQEPKGAFDDHAEWGACQVGTAAAFVEGAEDDLALFGAPGCFTWRGNVFGQEVGKARRYDVAVNIDTVRGYSKHGHMGLSVASGRFFDGEMYYVSGAPQAGTGQYGSRTGEVYFFQKDPSIDGLLSPTWDYTLRGETFGSGFGYSLATLDANGDSVPDILVGVPFHDGGKTGRGGAVFLYLSKRGSLDHEGKFVRIMGAQLESQFGLALTNLGDLNHDGFEDFAVGAPYEKKGGSVYIFFGGQKGLRSHGPVEGFLHAEEVADQIIYGEDMSKNVAELPRKMKTFGSSLSGGSDMDGNGYPDLLVGAYQSNHVFLLRSRPIIDITTSVDETKLKGIDPGQSGCEDDPDAEESCFGFSACFSVDKEVSAQGLGLTFRIEADPKKKALTRVWMRLKKDSNGERSKVVTDTIRIQNGHRRQGYCTDVVGYVGAHSDLQTPVQFAMSYSIIQEEPSMVYRRGYPLPDIDAYPILNQAQAKKKFQATFEKDCGDDDICQSQLRIEPTLRDTFSELGKTPGGYYELQLGSLNGSELVLDVDVSNLGEAAYEASLDVYFPTAVSYIGLGEDTKMKAPELKNETWIQFSLGNPFKGKNHSTNVQLRFRPKKQIEEKVILFMLSANTSSEQVVDASQYVRLFIVRTAEVRIVGRGFPEEVHYGGRVRGESSMAELPEVGPQLVHKFQVINAGPSEVGVLTVEIDWPYQVENQKPQGKWLLYLTEHPLLKNGRGDCVLPPGIAANTLNLTRGHDGITARHAPFQPSHHGIVYAEELSAQEDGDIQSQMNSLKGSTNRKRSKREVEQVILPQTVTGPNGRQQQVVTFDCDRGSAKCLRILCQIYDLPEGRPVTIEIRSRLWNSTLVEDYNEVDAVEIWTKAKISVDPDITQDISDDYESVRTVAYPDARKLMVDSGPEWWVILVAVLLGLLLLVVISLVLWKFGFFKRKRPLEDDDTDFMMSAHFEKVRLNGAD